ncbi:MAG: phytanoyl-CoA dioxygenase family protein [Acidimicrobiales bacterium]|nr:phytanoyl-CoA dioxygenase family protein [Acidimicrobiales bacterium]
MHEVLRRMGGSLGGAEAARAMGPDHRLVLRIGEAPAVTVRTTTEGTVLEKGDAGARVVVALDDEAFRALAAEELSIFGLLYSGVLRVERGTFDQFAAWEPALQALLYDRPVYDHAAAAPFVGEDLARSFTLDHDPAPAAAFLQRFGYLHVRGVFTADEVRHLADEVERLRAAARPDDGHSWWATDASGAERCCRITYMAQHSDRIAALADEPRLHRLATLSGETLLPAPDRNDGISVVIKNPAITAGLSDLPWHRDCGLGGHPLLCPGLNIGLQLDRADARNGQLWFLPGSHHHGGPLGDPIEQGYPVVAIDAEPGDVTVHFGHVLHAAPPPAGTDAGRRAVYVQFSRPELFEVIPAGKAYNDVIYAGGDGRVRSIAEQATA